MFEGLAQLIDLIGLPFPLVNYSDGIPGLDEQYHILSALRSGFSRS
jgi:hypothetical protein